MGDTVYDVVVIGTSLAESIAAAALAKSGLKILHIDSADDYGGRDATITPSDIQSFLASPNPHIFNITNPIPPSESLLRESRHYSISLNPTIVPSVGPLITCLIDSAVSRYVRFKLLDSVGIYSCSTQSQPEINIVPASKEDVFKHKRLSLVEKRKLMKFLLLASKENFTSPLPDWLNDHENEPFLTYLMSDQVGLSKDIADAVAFGLAFCSSTSEPTLPALLRIQKYIKASGRHGNSSFLVGHYGGAGELAQGYSRTCAVAGGTYILGKPFSLSYSTRPKASESGECQQEKMVSISVDGIEDTLLARVVVSTLDALPAGWIPTPNAGDNLDSSQRQMPSQSRTLARAVVIVDRPIRFGPKEEESSHDPEEDQKQTSNVDTVVVVFPPGALETVSDIHDRDRVDGAVTVMISGEESRSCPNAQWILYFSANIQPNQSPETALSPYIDAIIRLSGPGPIPPLFTLFYSQALPSSAECGVHEQELPEALVTVIPPTSHLAEFGDAAAQEGERIFWEVVKRLNTGEEFARLWPPIIEEEENNEIDDW